MYKKLFIGILVLLTSTIIFAQAGDDRLKEIKEGAKKEVEDGWIIGGGIGLDLTGLGLINPRIGAGDNKFGIGGLGTFFGNWKKGKGYWNNDLNLQLAAQRFRTDKSRFVKSLDVIRFGTRYGYQIKDKLYGAIDGSFETLVMNTYPGNLLSPENPTDKKEASFLSPARFTLAPGLDYKHNEHFSVFLAPAGLKMIVIGDQEIANLGIHGTELVDETDLTRGYEKSFFQLGANLKAKYNNKFFKDKVTFTSGIDLFSNYLKNPENIDVLWGNNLNIAITEGLSLDFLGELFYDHDIDVQVDRNNNDEYEGVEAGEVGKRASMVGAWTLKYSKIF